SRTSTVSASVREYLLSKASQQGYDTSRLIWLEDDSKIGKGEK
ncbi:lipocalin family protein, partial [Pseudomonas syringae pv. tagetis]